MQLSNDFGRNVTAYLAEFHRLLDKMNREIQKGRTDAASASPYSISGAYIRTMLPAYHVFCEMLANAEQCSEDERFQAFVRQTAAALLREANAMEALLCASEITEQTEEARVDRWNMQSSRILDRMLRRMAAQPASADIVCTALRQIAPFGIGAAALAAGTARYPIPPSIQASAKRQTLILSQMECSRRQLAKTFSCIGT